MDELNKIKKNLLNKLMDFEDKEITTSTLSVIDSLTHTIKNLCKIIDDDGYSGNYPYMYSDGTRSYTRRDSMGRYSRNSLTDKLRELMNDAPDDHSRMEIKRLIEKMD